jgi:hypothetical protein
MDKAFAIEFRVWSGGKLQVWHTLFATPQGAHEVCYRHRWDYVRVVPYVFQSEQIEDGDKLDSNRQTV